MCYQLRYNSYYSLEKVKVACKKYALFCTFCDIWAGPQKSVFHFAGPLLKADDI